MNGTKYFLDTNSIIALLKGNPFIEEKLTKADWIATSVICVIEFLSFPNLSEKDKNLLDKLLKRIIVLDIPYNLDTLAFIATLRKAAKLKLPDAIIASAAIHSQAILISTDKHFSAIQNLSVLEFS